jgi:hypothetical protein
MSAQSTKVARPADVRGSLIIYHDLDELDNVETASTGGDSIMDISEDSFATVSDQETTRLPEEPPQPLNEITEEEEEDDEVVTVLKTPHANPLHVLSNFAAQDEFLESPLAGKSGVPRNEDMDLEGSDKENVPAFPVKRAPATPRPSDRSDSYVTAPMSFAGDEPALPEESEEDTVTLATIQAETVVAQPEEPIIETQVPLATSPPEHQMHLPSLPTRAPLNMKKSFGVRKSHRSSLMDALAGRASIIPNRKTFFGQTIQPDPQADPTPTPAAPVAESVETLIPAEVNVEATVVTPVHDIPNPITHADIEEAPQGTKEKDDTITIIDTELHLGDQRLMSKFTTDSQRIHDALNSLRTKSTPGQPLRDGQEKIIEAETPAPVRGEEQAIDIDDDEDWVPKKDYSSLSERLANGQTNAVQTVKAVNDLEEQPTEIKLPPPVINEKEPSSPPRATAPIASVASSSPLVTFKSAAAQAAEVIRNAMAVITHPEPEKSQPQPQPSNNLYPQLDMDDDPDPDPMTDVHDENFTVHYDERLSLDSRRDSTYFTQSEGPSQPSQPDISTQPSQPTHEHRQSHTTMPPPRKEQFPTKPKPVSIRVPTASQRQKEQQKKVAQPIYPTLSQSRSVPDLATPGKLARDDSRMSSVSLQSTGNFVRGAGQIKALNAAKLAKQKAFHVVRLG